MLRLVLDWLSQNESVDHDLSFSSGDKWYSEALLPSAFLARNRGDKLAESWTHADSVIGNFAIGANREGDLSLVENATRILVTEAKMFSKLSAGVKNASYFNQAARNVACIAEVIKRSEIPVSQFSKIAFYVIAPESRIQEGVFAEYMDSENILSIIERRVSDYQEPLRNQWFDDWFIPTMEKIHIKEISWEEIVDLINQSDSLLGKEIGTFYAKCLQFNKYVPNRFG